VSADLQESPMVMAYLCLLLAAGLVACSLSQPHWYTGVASSRGNLRNFVFG